MALEQETNKILKDYLERVKLDIIKSQNQLGLKASGFSAAHLKFNKSQKKGQAFLVSPVYLPLTFDGVGVKPFKIFPWRQLTQWLRFKPIGGVRDSRGRFIPRKSLAYLMASKIWQKGTAIFRGKKGIPIKEILEKNLPETGREIAEAYARDLITDIRKINK